MKASLSEYSEKLRHQEGKVKVRVGGRGKEEGWRRRGGGGRGRVGGGGGVQIVNW